VSTLDCPGGGVLTNRCVCQGRATGRSSRRFTHRQVPPIDDRLARGGECPADAVAEQCQPLDWLVAEHEADVTIGNLPSQARIGVTATFFSSRRSETSTQSSPSAVT
jgi:hypothetical protein